MRHCLAVRRLKIPDVVFPDFEFDGKFLAELDDRDALPVSAVDLVQIVLCNQRQVMVSVDGLGGFLGALPRAVIDRVQRDLPEPFSQIRNLLPPFLLHGSF